MTERLHGGSGVKSILFVWLVLLASTLLEVFVAYRHLAGAPTLVLLLILALVNGYFIVAFFMHLKDERRSLILTLVPATIYVLAMMTMLFPDGIRLHLMKPPLH
jgi:cytochrome c oxidase subunit IV